MTAVNEGGKEGRYETSFRRLFEAAKDGILILDAFSGEIIEVNPFLTNLLGYAEAELIGKKLWDIGLIQDQGKSVSAYQELKRTGYVRYEDLPLKTKNGERRDVEFVSNVYEANGKQVIQCNIRDISDRKRVDTALAQTNESLRVTVKELADRNHEISLLSELGDSLQTCVSIDEAYRVVARFSVQLFPGTQGVLYTINAAQNFLESAIQWGGVISGENDFVPNDCVSLRRGRVHSVNGEELISSPDCRHVDPPASNYLCAPMIAYGEIQGVLHLRSKNKGDVGSSEGFKKSQSGLAGTIADYIGLALANLKLREKLRRQSIQDPVTGLYNRRYMKEALERELRRSLRGQRPLGILMLDIDRFKKMNDSFGHEAGDAVLEALGNFLKDEIRGNDIPCRYGGEEFLVILPGISLEECLKRAEKIRDGVKGLDIRYDGKSLPALTFSIGISGFPEHGESLVDLIKAADGALYAAKESGRDQVVVAQMHPPVPLKKVQEVGIK